MATVLTLGSIHLHATTPPATAYNGSGTPWTVQSTTPFELAMNDKTGPFWTPKPADAQSIYGGGPPFRNGSDLFYLNYDNVVETIPIHIRATSHDNAVAALRILRQELKKAQWTTPPVLAFQPNAATNAVSFDVYNGDVAETASFVNEEAGRGVLRAVITLTRSFVGGRLSTGETLLNAVSMKNTGTGSPNNMAAFSTGAGDMLYEGQPLNLTLGLSNAVELNLASAASRTYTASGATGSVTSTIFPLFSATYTVPTVLTQPVLKARMFPRFSSTSNCEARLNVAAGSSGIYYTSPWVTVVSGIVDLGNVPLDIIRNRNQSNPTLFIGIDLRSTSGTQSYTLTDVDFILYYTFCKLYLPNTPGGDTTFITTFTEVSGRPCLPVPQQIDVRDSTASYKLTGIGIIKGTAPRYYSGASLYLARAGQASTVTTTVTATHSPLFKSLRGGA
jgi:hypothetical protein